MSEYGEPWRIEDGLMETSTGYILGEGEHIERIVACVNACAGVPIGKLYNTELRRKANQRSKYSTALELLDLYLGPQEGIADRREAFLVKRGWEKREDQWVCATNPTIKPISWEWVKGDKKCSFGGALAEEAGVQFRGLK